MSTTSPAFPSHAQWSLLQGLSSAELFFAYFQFSWKINACSQIRCCRCPGFWPWAKFLTIPNFVPLSYNLTDRGWAALTQHVLSLSVLDLGVFFFFFEFVNISVDLHQLPIPNLKSIDLQNLQCLEHVRGFKASDVWIRSALPLTCICWRVKWFSV